MAKNNQASINDDLQDAIDDLQDSIDSARDVLDAANDVTSSREDLAQAVVDALDALSRTETRTWKTTTGGIVAPSAVNPPDRKPVDRITDRAKRYRAQKAIRVPGVVYFAARGADWT